MMNIKKKIMVIFATGIMAFSASPFVLAATPAPANNTQQAEQVDTSLSAGCILVYIHYYNQCNYQLLDWKQILQTFKER